MRCKPYATNANIQDDQQPSSDRECLHDGGCHRCLNQIDYRGPRVASHCVGFFFDLYSSTRYDARSATPSLPTYLSRWHGQQRQKLPTYLPGEVFVTVRHVIKTDERHFRSVDSNHVVASAASCQ